MQRMKYPSKSKKNLKFWWLYFNCLEYRPEETESIPNLLSYVGVNLHRFGLRAILEFEIWRQYGGYYSLIHGHFEIRLMKQNCSVIYEPELIWTSMTPISIHSIINPTSSNKKVHQKSLNKYHDVVHTINIFIKSKKSEPCLLQPNMPNSGLKSYFPVMYICPRTIIHGSNIWRDM